MKISIRGLFGNDSDGAWEWFGAHDPYYGVVTWSEFRKGNLSDETLRAFFDTGVAHITRVLDIISRHFGELATNSCLDFGCGVGRLVVPFAARFGRVVGIDISPSMIREALKNCSNAGVHNVAFFRDLSELQEKFDLVHSYIVLQHIPVSRGLAIIDRLINAARPGGICFMHFTIGRNAGPLRALAAFCRKNFKPAQYIINLFQGKRLSEAYMQMNEYKLNKFVAHLYERNIRQLWLESERHRGSYYSVSTVFRVPSQS